MGKFNCCVPNCANNWRNSPELKFHSLPRDPKVFAQYVRLIRNGNLKEFSVTDNTKICGKHFPNGERVCRTQLPTIFPWSKPVKRRRDIIKYDLPLRSMTIEDNSSTALPKDQAVLCQDNTIFSELNLNVNQQNGDLDNKENKDEIELVSTKFQTEQFDLHDSCNQEVDRLKEEVNLLQSQLDKLDISFFTGFPNYSSMVMCFDMLKGKAANLSYGGRRRLNFDEKKCGTKRKLSLWQEYTLVLLRLRLGLLERDLAERFRVSVSTVSEIFRTWIRFMKCELQPLCIVWPSKEQLKFYMPPVFKELYPDLVSIIDCTEIRMESPSSLDKQSVCYSSYKAHTTMKALVGITPNGVVSFASELYCGSISDPDIVEKSGFLNYMQKGDLVMADKGFLIQDQLAAHGASLVMPNFLSDKCQFTKKETEHNKKVASLRIHVERYMERLKNWHYFDRVIPITTSSIASDAWIVIACMSNFWPPMIT